MSTTADKTTTVTVALPWHVERQLMTYLNAVTTEIGGLGTCAFEDGVLRVKSLVLPSQEVGAAHTELDQEDVARLLGERAKAGELAPLNFWWHSHVNMGTFWSATDDATCERLAEGVPYFLALVACQDGRMKARLEVRQPVVLTLDDLPIEIEHPPVSQEQADAWTAEAKAALREKTWGGYQGADTRLPYHYQEDGWTGGYEYDEPAGAPTGKQKRTLADGERVYPPPVRAKRYDGTYQTLVSTLTTDRDDADYIHHIGCHALFEKAACIICTLADCVQCVHNVKRKKWAGIVARQAQRLAAKRINTGGLA